ncbi:MAG: nucleotidyltransferase family protein [Eubacteriales bacterium]|nr:nucleotidyltransferase family protein [Eubacteriales bacterium]
MYRCAVIAAAGLSSRMGAFKPLLPFDGEPAVVHLLKTLYVAGIDQIILVTGHRHRELAEVCAPLPGVTLLHNAHYAQTQMFDSLCLGLSQLPPRCDRVLLAPADVPLVTADTVYALAHAGAPLLYPSYQHRCGHPISLNASLVPSLLHHHGPGGLKGALHALPIQPVYLTVDDPFIRMDMDLPADYHALLQLHRTFARRHLYVSQTQYVERAQLAATPTDRTQYFYP